MERGRKKGGGLNPSTTSSYITPKGITDPPFLGPSPLTMVSTFVVAPKTHFKLESSPHTLRTSSIYA